MDLVAFLPARRLADLGSFVTTACLSPLGAFSHLFSCPPHSMGPYSPPPHPLAQAPAQGCGWLSFGHLAFEPGFLHVA